MIAEFINAFVHKVIQGYNTSGISSGADCSGKALNIITELDSNVPNTAQLALRKDKFRFPDAYGVLVFTSSSPCITPLPLLGRINLATLVRETGPRNPTCLPHLGSSSR